MTAFVCRRLLESIVVLVLVSVLTFSVMRLLPGDPLIVYIVQQDINEITPEIRAELEQKFGLDKSVPEQYVAWITGLFRGDMGQSIFFRDKVSTLMAERIPVTLYLGGISFVLSSILGIIAGLVAALRRASVWDNIVTAIANFGISVPQFWLGILMIYVFGLYFRLLPTQGYTSPFDNFGLSSAQLVMPVTVMTLWGMAFIARQTRSSMLEVTRQDYVRTAWSKGLRERVVVTRHVLKNGLIPVVTIMGVQLSRLISGMVIVENVFNIPGIGRLMVASVFSQDYQVVQAGVLITAVSVVLVNLLVDISYGWLDPRIRYQ